MRDGWDDERLLAALSEALKAREAVPSWFIETGKNAFAWHNIDAELAQLTYDSNEDLREAAVVRSETASVRSLTFTSSHLTVELEVAASSVLGQIIPPRSGTLEIHTKAGAITTTEMDEIGCFAVDPTPVHRARGHRGLPAWPGHPASGRDARDPYQGRRDQRDRGGRDRLLRRRPHAAQPVPLALPHGRRHRRADRVDHVVSLRMVAGRRRAGQRACGRPAPGYGQPPDTVNHRIPSTRAKTDE